jgi:sRNA-binding carbon storage regulator CsrA
VLCVSIGEGDYVRIGDTITVHFNRKKGKALILGIEAPPDVRIQRCKVYEDGVAKPKSAAEGDPEAQARSRKLQDEHRARRQSYETPRTPKNVSPVAAS